MPSQKQNAPAHFHTRGVRSAQNDLEANVRNSVRAQRSDQRSRPFAIQTGMETATMIAAKTQAVFPNPKDVVRKPASG